MPAGPDEALCLQETLARLPHQVEWPTHNDGYVTELLSALHVLALQGWAHKETIHNCHQKGIYRVQQTSVCYRVTHASVV